MLPRNAPRGTASRTATAAPVAVASVELRWSENRAVPRARFPSIWAADAALAAAFAREPPPPGRAYDKTDVVIHWADATTHTTRLDVTTHAVATAPARGGLLRAHLDDEARWLASDDFVRLNVGRRAGDEIAAVQAYGQELARRLAADRAAQVEPRAPRNTAAAARPAGEAP